MIIRIKSGERAFLILPVFKGLMEALQAQRLVKTPSNLRNVVNEERPLYRLSFSSKCLKRG